MATRVETTGASEVLSTLTREGKRRWICPKVSDGRFLRARRWVAWGLIAVFTLVPYVRLNDRPLVLLDVAARRFTLFGTTFLPTDTVLLALLMVSIFVLVFLMTALFGRVWCGWACPQTVYVEFVYRPIERLLGLGRPGSKGTPLARGVKFVVYLLVSMYLAHTFLAYFVGVERLAQWVRQSPAQHPAPFFVMLATTAAMMFDFGYFREQTCIVACPYGRFQSVMLDRDSTIVAYDRTRGEPRGKKRAATGDVALPVLGEDEARIGDCIDCRLCVTTCPTGIDIRNGLQMECVNCAQCIDACDAVMAKIGRDPGLIRYASQRELAGESRRRVRPRVAIYATLLAVLGSLFLFALATKSLATVIIVRGRGAPFTVMPDGTVMNRVNVKVTNRTDRPVSYTVEVVGVPGASARHEEGMDLGPEEARVIPTSIVVPFDAFSRGRASAVIRVSDTEGRFTKDVKYTLMGPGTMVERSESQKEDDDEEQ